MSNQRCGRGDEDRVQEWEAGLPNSDDLTPLFQPLISSELASAFSISPERYRTMIDVNRASQTTVSNINQQDEDFSSSHLKSLPSLAEDQIEKDDEDDEAGRRKIQRTENTEEDQSAQTLKRQRLVWNPQLHKRFVEVVGHLGIKNAVPKTIMQMMNVEGLTRENVASHLQKYRLYLKRMQGLSNEGPSSSDPLFATTPIPHNLNESGGQGHVPMHPIMPYGAQVMSMPVYHDPASRAYHGFQSQQYHMFNSMGYHPYVNQNDK